jgi:hypothetical protein
MAPPKLKGARKQTQYRAAVGDAKPEKAFDKGASRLKGAEGRMQTYDEVMEEGGDEDHCAFSLSLEEVEGGEVSGGGGRLPYTRLRLTRMVDSPPQPRQDAPRRLRK